MSRDDQTKPTKVVRTPGYIGGAPRVDGTRVPAMTIVAELRAGEPDTSIFENYPSLPKDGIDAVRDWVRERGIDLTLQDT